MKYAFHSDAGVCLEVTVPYVTTTTNFFKKQAGVGGVGKQITDA